MDKHIMFIMTPFLSHILPTFKLAKHFQELGYKIVYVSTNKLEKAIIEAGFIFQNSSIRDDSNIFLKVDKLIPHLVFKYKPELCLVELSFWNWALFLIGMRQKFMMIQTWPCCNKAPYVMPEGYRYVKNRNVFTFLINELAWIKQNMRNKKAFSNGEFNQYYKDVIKKAKLNPLKRYITKHNRIGYYKVLNVPEIVLSPKELDFPRKPNPLTNFIGPFLDMDRVEQTFEWSKISIRSRPIVYCSLGSLSSIFKKRSSFYNRMIEAFKKRNDMFLIMSVGNSLEELQKNSIPENIHLCEYAPQLNILKKASVFITHGGAGSIKESILFGVPMIVYPWQSRSDMFGNADRIVFHDLGLLGDIESDSVSDILGRIDYLTDNSIIQNGVTRMQSIFQNYEQKELSAINYLLKLKNKW